MRNTEEYKGHRFDPCPCDLSHKNLVSLYTTWFHLVSRPGSEKPGQEIRSKKILTKCSFGKCVKLHAAIAQWYRVYFKSRGNVISLAM